MNANEMNAYGIANSSVEFNDSETLFYYSFLAWNYNQ